MLRPRLGPPPIVPSNFRNRPMVRAGASPVGLAATRSEFCAGDVLAGLEGGAPVRVTAGAHLSQRGRRALRGDSVPSRSRQTGTVSVEQKLGAHDACVFEPYVTTVASGKRPPDDGVGGRVACRGSRTVNVVPSSSLEATVTVPP